jgi:ABC-2 type transport system ATP-binding protein
MDDAVRSLKLVKIYQNEVEALKEVSISIHKGELFTLLGPNGAGKTTFLRIISTQLLPTEGDAYVLGYSVLDEPKEVRKHIAVVPQDAATYGIFTPWEYAYYFAKLRGMSTRNAKGSAEKALKVVDLWDLKNRPCMGLSGGEKKRALISSALASDADVLMLDEPTSGLDAVARRRVWAALRDMVKENKTVLLTTHMMEEAEMVSDRLAIISKGKVIAEGKPNEIKNLVKERYRVVIEGDFDGLSEYGEVMNIGDKHIVYVKSEDVFVKLVGGTEN